MNQRKRQNGSMIIVYKCLYIRAKTLLHKTEPALCIFLIFLTYFSNQNHSQGSQFKPTSEGVPQRMGQSWPWDSQIAVKKDPKNVHMYTYREATAKKNKLCMHCLLQLLIASSKMTYSLLESLKPFHISILESSIHVCFPSWQVYTILLY